VSSTAIARVWTGELSRLSKRLTQTVKGEPTTLLRKAQDGDAGAIERLIELYQDTIYSMALSFTKNPHQAEDLAQEAWIKILRGLPKFRQDSKFSTWMYRVTMNTFLNANRAAKREQEVVGALDTPDLGAEPFMGDIRVETALDVQGAVRELSAEFRSVVLLRYVADLSYKEIASVLELPLGTVQSRLKRGLTKLGAQLGHQGYSPAE
jgi:RNA polymerase sigma-70 factor (ECF subfamily)